MIVAHTIIKTEFGDFDVNYHSTKDGFCVSFSKGNLSESEPIVRIHSACLFGEVFHSIHCDCDHQLTETMQLIAEKGAGVIVYLFQEGRGIGLKNKIRAMESERTRGHDTVQAFHELGFKKSDYRSYGAAIQALIDLNITKKVLLVSGNPQKIKSLENAGFCIFDRLNVPIQNLSAIAMRERRVKQEKLGYFY